MSESTMKQCRTCQEVLPIEQFTKQKNAPDGLRYDCKGCNSKHFKAYYHTNLQTQRARDRKRYATEREMRSNAHYKRKYGLSLEEYQALLNQQNGVCAICRKPERIIWARAGREPRLRPLSVDHDHATGEIRGLLCSDCNTMLGHINDSIEVLQNAIDYLSRK